MSSSWKDSSINIAGVVVVVAVACSHEGEDALLPLLLLPPARRLNIAPPIAGSVLLLLPSATPIAATAAVAVVGRSGERASREVSSCESSISISRASPCGELSAVAAPPKLESGARSVRPKSVATFRFPPTRAPGESTCSSSEMLPIDSTLESNISKLSSTMESSFIAASAAAAAARTVVAAVAGCTGAGKRAASSLSTEAGMAGGGLTSDSGDASGVLGDRSALNATCDGIGDARIGDASAAVNGTDAVGDANGAGAGASATVSSAAAEAIAAALLRAGDIGSSAAAVVSRRVTTRSTKRENCAALHLPIACTTSSFSA